MKNGIDVVESIYIYLLSRKKYPKDSNFPKNFGEYKSLRRCNPEIIDQYIKFLQDEKQRAQERFQEEGVSRVERSTLEILENSICSITSIYENVNRANERWSENFASNAIKEEDSTACETKQSSEESSSIVTINESLNQHYLPKDFDYPIISESYILVYEEYNDLHILEEFSFWGCCGCKFFNNFF